MAEPTVAAGFAKALMELAVSKGADRRLLLERSHIDADDLSNQNNRIPLTNYMALLNAGVDLCNEPALSLQFGEAYAMPDLSIVGFISQSASTVANAYARAKHYAPLLIDMGEDAASDRFKMTRSRDGLWMELTGDVYVDFPRLTESAFARSFCFLSQNFGDMPVVKAVHFTHEEPGYRSEYDRIFKAPIVFGCDRNALLVDESILSLDLSPSNPYVSGILSAHADTLLESLESSKTVRGQVESLLVPLLHTGGPGMDRIAKKMGLSRPALYRKLRDEGLSYATVLDGLRHKMAMHYLNRENLSVKETTYLVGFSDPAAFSRAFKRWTGHRPGTARARKPGQ